MAQITEGLAQIEMTIPNKISKKMEVFYNPKMKENRDLAVTLLRALDRKNMTIMSPLAGSGVREIRFLKELSNDAIKKIIINDYGENAYRLILKNLKLNEFDVNNNDKNNDDNSKITVLNFDANKCMIDNMGFDYVEIDPFGTPNPYLNNAIWGLSRDGILAVTATDTSSICGTYRKTCERNYFAKPLNNYLKHETSLRILIRKVQLIGTQFEKALIPIFTYAQEHYVRVYFLCEKQKTKCDKIIEQHKFLSYSETDGSFEWGIRENYKKENYTLIGPMWSGELWDKNLVKKMRELLPSNKLLQKIEKEMDYPPLYYNTHVLSGLNNQKFPPRHDGFDSTHFDKHCVKSKLSPKEFIQKYIKRIVD